MVYCIIMGLCALMMYGIGISQVRSEKPVGFYSGEKPPEAEQLKDVKTWNRKHGIMWILYGVVITIGGIVGVIVGDSLLFALIECLSLLVPVIFMIFYHKKLVKQLFLG
ncbi:MAG: hypothetical protein IJ733_20100 [Lachnospiraceae bacterium]|nr:hypothetical protein [Lachnospiraceae bacterium]